MLRVGPDDMFSCIIITPWPVWSYCLIIWLIQIEEAIGNGDNGKAVQSVCP